MAAPLAPAAGLAAALMSGRTVRTVADRLKDKAALVTGAGSGIGAATATLFAREGAAVALADLRPDPVRERARRRLPPAAARRWR